MSRVPTPFRKPYFNFPTGITIEKVMADASSYFEIEDEDMWEGIKWAAAYGTVFWSHVFDSDEAHILFVYPHLEHETELFPALMYEKQDGIFTCIGSTNINMDYDIVF